MRQEERRISSLLGKHTQLTTPQRRTQRSRKVSLSQRLQCRPLWRTQPIAQRHVKPPILQHMGVPQALDMASLPSGEVVLKVALLLYLGQRGAPGVEFQYAGIGQAA